MLLERGEIAIFGAGPAGLSCARNLLRQGLNVTIVQPEVNTEPRSVYTTLIDGSADLWFDPSLIKPLSFLRIITTHGVDFRVPTPLGAYFMLDNQRFVDGTAKDLQSQGVKMARFPWTTLRNLGINEQENGVVVQIDGSRQKFDLVVDCTGIDASIVKKVDPLRQREDFLAEYVYGGAFRGEMDLDEMVIVVGPAGGTSWVCPSILPGFVDIVYSAGGPASRFKDLFLPTARSRLNKLVNFLYHQQGINIVADQASETYYGMIRSHPAPLTFSKRIFSVGESAGMARPMSGDSIRFALKGGELLAQAVKEGLDASRFQREWQRRWRPDLFLALVLTRLSDQRNGDLGRKYQYLAALVASNDRRIVSDAEDLIIKGKINSRLVWLLMRDPSIRSFLVNFALKRMEIFIRGSHRVSIPWTLPEVS